MSLIALISALIAGWFGWSAWLAIPLGILAYIGGKRALPEARYRISHLGIPMYCLGTFVVMMLAGWAHTAIIG